MWFRIFMEVFVTPTTLLIGLIGNTVSICVLRKTKEIQVKINKTYIVENITIEHKNYIYIYIYIYICHSRINLSISA